MDFEKTNENCILAQLSDEDMTDLGLTYDDLDYSDEKTRVALRHILSLAKNITHNSHDFNSKLRIDVMPGTPDGCMILFTDLSCKYEDAVFDEPLIFESDCFDNVADCAKALSSLEIAAAESELYGDGDVFRLVVVGVDDKTVTLISEYMDICRSDSLTVARTKENMKCLIEKNALEILCGKRTQG